jgi:hypothetical protein
VTALALALVLGAAPQAGFWDWFVKHEARLADAAAVDPVAAMKEIQAQLDRHEEDLVVELMLDKTPSLVVSADGNASLFGAVKRVVAAAPKLKRWSVVAFRPRRPWMGDLEIEGRKFALADFSFRELGRVKGQIDIEVAVRGRTEANEKEVDNAAFLVLDVVLGEYDTETKIGVVDFSSTPKKSHRPITELAALVDKL